MQCGGEFTDFHLAAVARKNFQYSRQPVNDLNGRAPSDHGLFCAFSGWLRLQRHDQNCETLPALWDERTLFNSVSCDVKAETILGFILLLQSSGLYRFRSHHGFANSLFAVQ